MSELFYFRGELQVGVKIYLLTNQPRHSLGTKWAHNIFKRFLCAQNHKSGQNFNSRKTTQTLDITAIKKPQSIDWGFWNMVGII